MKNLNSIKKRVWLGLLLVGALLINKQFCQAATSTIIIDKVSRVDSSDFLIDSFGEFIPGRAGQIVDEKTPFFSTSSLRYGMDLVVLDSARSTQYVPQPNGSTDTIKLISYSSMTIFVPKTSLKRTCFTYSARVLITVNRTVSQVKDGHLVELHQRIKVPADFSYSARKDQGSLQFSLPAFGSRIKPSQYRIRLEGREL